MADLFDGLAGEIVADPNFGEPVIYKPLANGIPLGTDGTIRAKWNEDHVLAGEGVGADGLKVTCDVLVTDVANPVEGDTIERVKTGYLGRVVPPIEPDGAGFILCTLQKIV